jgi:hypothetical protein
LAFVAAIWSFAVPASSSATCPCPYVNHLTRELHVFDEDVYVGIGWHPYGRGSEEREREIEGKYLADGYRQTDSPHKIEAIVAVFCVFLVFIMVSFWFVVVIKTRRMVSSSTIDFEACIR